MTRAIALSALLLAGCQGPPDRRIDLCVAPADLPAIRPAAGGREALDLAVLIYNVEGLPWPARRSRAAQLDRIGDELARLRAAGRAPDVVMLQEAFTDRARAIADRAGYRNVVRGPAASARRSLPGAAIGRPFQREARLLKGEGAPKLLNSGLLLLSDYPIMAARAEPFSRPACAGYDCLANKGALFARIWIPGVPSPVDIFTTHMNSQKAARVDLARAHAAHRFQTDENATFLAQVRDRRNPLVFGGDFNMRRAPGRLDHFRYRQPYHIVRHYCTVVAGGCDVRMSWDGDAPWLDTQDLQGFDDGAVVSVRPLIAEALFDGPDSGGRLSDHDAYKVTYRLTWPQGANDDEARAVGLALSERRSVCMPPVRR